MLGAHRGAVQREDPAALEDTVDDRQREVVVMQHVSPGGDGFVGGKYHRTASLVAVVDDMEEHVRGVGAVGEIAYFIDDEQARMGVGGERVSEATRAESGGEVVDEFRGSDEVGVGRGGRIGRRAAGCRRSCVYDTLQAVKRWMARPEERKEAGEF